jgi:transcriptional regulator with XRE-family HTH domain
MDEKEVCGLLGKSIKRFRGQNKWSQEFLAEKLDISANFLSNIENGKAWISPKTLAKLASTFKVEPATLFMPDGGITPATADILANYTETAQKQIISVLDDIKERFLLPEYKGDAGQQPDN